MLFHTKDLPAMKACWKRAGRYAKQGPVEGQHLVWLSNAKAAQGYQYDVQPLSWLATKIDQWCQDNLIDNNDSMAGLLHEWQQLMPCDPTKLVTAKPQEGRYTKEGCTKYLKDIGLWNEDNAEWLLNEMFDTYVRESEIGNYCAIQ